MGAYGWRKPTPDSRDFKFSPPTAYTGEFVDLTSSFPVGVYDQGELGSCVSNGCAALQDYARIKQGLAALLPPSRLFIYYQGRVRGNLPVDEDTGLQVRDGLTVLSKDGAPPETDWPYDIAKFAKKPDARAYEDATNDVATVFGQVDQSQIDDTIASGYPVVFGIELWESFESTETAQNGVVSVPDKDAEQELGGHCMVIVSTQTDGSEIPGAIAGVKYRKVRNSWGASWGDEGYCWIPVEILDGPDVSDLWMLTHVSDPNVPNPPVPSGDADHVFAAVLHPWVRRGHTSINGNRKVATAARTWLTAKNL